jgi:hypothetical protein
MRVEIAIGAFADAIRNVDVKGKWFAGGGHLPGILCAPSPGRNRMALAFKPFK